MRQRKWINSFPDHDFRSHFHNFYVSLASVHKTPFILFLLGATSLSQTAMILIVFMASLSAPVRPGRAIEIVVVILPT
jgi:hypothetical protein